MDNKIEQKRDRKGLIILVLLLVAIVSTTFAVTFSRYMTSAEATTEATVAKWEVKIGKENGTLTDITTGSIALDNCTWDNTVSTAAAGTMAPGSICNYNIEVENNSEVDALVDFAVTGVQDSDGNSVSNTNITAEVVGTSPVEVAKGDSEVVTLRIQWAAGPTQPNNDQTRVDTDMGLDPDDLTIYLDISAQQKINS